MISNTSFSSFPQYISYNRPDSWENYFQANSQSAFETPSYPQPVSEMVFEKPRQPPAPMMEEEFVPFNPEIITYTHQELLSNMEEIDFAEMSHYPDFEIQRDQQREQQMEQHEREQNTYNDDEYSQYSRCQAEKQEELGTISTQGSNYAELSNFDDNVSYKWEENSTPEPAFDLENELRVKVANFASQRSDEEKEYIKKVYPLLMSSLRQICVHNPVPITDDIMCAILKELLYGKELMLGAEREALAKMVNNEMRSLKEARPDTMVTEDDLMAQNRKEKKASKGNRNSSNLNHLNENYVSNIFQFAKRNYPQDKDVQRIGNERNVSAANFKKLMRPKLNDDLWARQAKARITGNGQELLGNIQYWMKDGYFEQCADREKYILHKDKAIRDLALAGRY